MFPLCQSNPLSANNTTPSLAIHISTICKARNTVCAIGSAKIDCILSHKLRGCRKCPLKRINTGLAMIVALPMLPHLCCTHTMAWDSNALSAHLVSTFLTQEAFGIINDGLLAISVEVVLQAVARMADVLNLKISVAKHLAYICGVMAASRLFSVVDLVWSEVVTPGRFVSFSGSCAKLIRGKLSCLPFMARSIPVNHGQGIEICVISVSRIAIKEKSARTDDISADWPEVIVKSDSVA